MVGHVLALDELTALVFVDSDAVVAIEQHLQAHYTLLLHLEVPMLTRDRVKRSYLPWMLIPHIVRWPRPRIASSILSVVLMMDDIAWTGDICGASFWGPIALHTLLKSRG